MWRSIIYRDSKNFDPYPCSASYKSFYHLGLSLLIYKVNNTDFPTSESYYEAPSVHTHTHSVALQIASQEMHSQQ